MRRNNRDLIIALVVAVAVHGVCGMYLGGVMVSRSSVLLPEFAEGESGVELTLLPSIEVQPTPMEPLSKSELLAELSKPEVVITPEPEVAIPERMVAESPNQEEYVAVESNADLLPKGIESLLVPKSNIMPRYPRISRERGEEGVVLVMVLVDSSGIPSKVQVEQSSGYPAIDRAALKACRAAEFIDKANNQPSGGEVVLTFRFRLVD